MRNGKMGYRLRLSRQNPDSRATILNYKRNQQNFRPVADVLVS